MKKIQDFAIDINRKLHKHEVILAYAGEIDNKAMNSIIDNIGEKIAKLEVDRAVQKKIYHVMVECLENLYRHNEKNPHEKATNEAPFAVFTLMKEEKSYYLTTGNYIKKEQITDLKSKLDKVNKMPVEEKKELYRAVLNNKTFSEKGGAGLGMIDIALRSSGEFSYEFKSVNDNFSFYIFQTKISN